MSIRTASALLLSCLSFLVLTPGLRAQGSDGARILESRQLSPTERMISLQIPAAKRARGPLYKTPPPQPPVAHELDAEEEGEEQRQVPVIDDGLAIPPEQTVETTGEQLNAPQTPGTLVILRDSTLTGMPAGFSSRVNEPNVGSQGNGIFTTHNWYAETSTDNGSTYSYISPYTLFPNTPADFSAGFCCDQRVAQDPSHDLIFWFLQYVQNGTTATSTNGDRLAVAHGQVGLAANTWDYYDLTPTFFGLSGKMFDFPHLQASANYLYFTTNIFTTSTGLFYGALVARMPLQALADGTAVTIDAFLTTAYGSIAAVNGAQAEGTRAGRTTMYFASLFSTTSLRVLTWPESTTTITVTSITGLPAVSTATFVCTGPDARNPCTRANTRMQTGWITDTELGFMFASAQNGAARPFPYTRVIILNPSTLAVLSQPDIFSTTSAWLYPALSVNERGHLAGTIDNLGGNVLPTVRAVVRDDFSPDVTVSGWETASVVTSTAGTAGLWGDYNGSMVHEKYPKTWLAVGHAQNGGPNDANSQPHNYWFGRERDTNPAFTVALAGTGTGTVTSSPAGISCGASCTNGFALGTTVTLTATPGASSTFAGWSGACTGTGSCVVLVDDAKSVTATFTLQTFTLTVSETGTGTGTVTSSPAGINCGATCAAAYDFNTSVTLTASAATGSTFTGWSGSGCSGIGTCVVTMDAAKSVTATFALQAFTLTVSKAGTGSGTVTSSPVGINCGATCASAYDFNTSVTLTASATTGSTFTGWSGSGCSGAGTCTVTIDSAKSVTATFTLSGPPGLDYFTVNPCRILDTRSDGGSLISGVPRSLAVAGVCGIPVDAVAVAINVTALEPPSTGRITIFPGNGLLPTTSTINFPLGKTLANNAIVALATDATGTLAAQSFLTSGGVIDFAVDIVGYFK